CLSLCVFLFLFFFSSRRRHTRFSRDWSSDVCSSDLVMKIFVKDIVGLTFPCLIAGLAVARLLAGKWLQNFIIQVDLHWWIFLGVGVFVILFTGIVSAWMSLKAARFNPVKALRY